MSTQYMTGKMFFSAALIAVSFVWVDAAYAGSATWTGLAGDDLLNTTGNWTAGGPPTASGDVATWNGTVGGNLTLNYNAGFGSSPLGTTINITGDQTGRLLIGTDNGSTFAIQNITIASGAGAFTFGDGTGSDPTVLRNTGVAAPYINTLSNNSTNTATFATNVTFASGAGQGRTLVFAGSGNWQVDAPVKIVSGGSGSFAVTKNDAGTLTLTAANTYTGATTINAGTLNLGGGTAAGSIASSPLVMAGGTLAYTTTGNQTQTFTGTTISSGASVLSVVTGNTLNLGAITRTAGATVNFDKITSGGTFLGSATLVNSILRWSTISSSGTAAANSANGFTFATVTGGAVVPFTAATSNSFGWSSTGAATVNYDVTGAAGSLGAARSANSVRFVGAADTIQQYYTTTLTLNALMNASTNSLTLRPDGASTPTFVIGDSNELVLSAAAGPITIAMPITGASGAVTKTGTNTVTLTAANTYAGTTTISAGSLQLGNGGTAGSLSTSSTIINNGTLIINRSNAVAQGTDFSGSAITGSGSLTHAGTGTTTLTAANTYSGATMVNNGTLVVAGSISSTAGTTVMNGALFVNGSLAGSVNVASGATLGGTNTITSALTLASGAILEPGTAANQIGTLTLSGTAPAISGLNLVADVSTTSGVCDKLALSGTIDLSGLTVTVKIPGTLPAANTYVVLSSTSLSGTPTLAGDLSYPWYLSVKNNTLVLSKAFGTMVSFF